MVRVPTPLHIRCRVALAGALAISACAHRPAPERWTPAVIASPQFESHPAFDPWTGDLYFVRSSPAFEGWRILVSHCTSAGWALPEPAPFSGAGVEADPFFADGGRTLYFISSRPTGAEAGLSLDIWRVGRAPDGRWEVPEHLPAPLNSSAAEWFPRPAADGWLYFGSSRPGGHGGNDIWRGRLDAGGNWRVENLGPAVNTAGQEYEAEPSPDGSRLIIATDQGLFETWRTAEGWAPRRRLGPEINVNATEIGPLLSPGGRSLLFARDTGAPSSGELFLWRRDGGDAGWPPVCETGPASARQ